MTSIIDIAAILISVSALFAYINLRFIGLPTTIGVMIVAMFQAHVRKYRFQQNLVTRHVELSVIRWCTTCQSQ